MCFNVLLTVHLSITLVNGQLDAQLLYFITSLLQSSTCSEQRRAHHQEVKLAAGIVTLCKWPSGMQVETCILDGHLQSDHTRCCISTICPPDDEHDFARNM